jgi:hypothetical protein
VLLPIKIKSTPTPAFFFFFFYPRVAVTGGVRFYYQQNVVQCFLAFFAKSAKTVVE